MSLHAVAVEDRGKVTVVRDVEYCNNHDRGFISDVRSRIESKSDREYGGEHRLQEHSDGRVGCALAGELHRGTHTRPRRPRPRRRSSRSTKMELRCKAKLQS